MPWSQLSPGMNGLFWEELFFTETCDELCYKKGHIDQERMFAAGSTQEQCYFTAIGTLLAHFSTRNIYMSTVISDAPDAAMLQCSSRSMQRTNHQASLFIILLLQQPGVDKISNEDYYYYYDDDDDDDDHKNDDGNWWYSIVLYHH